MSIPETIHYDCFRSRHRGRDVLVWQRRPFRRDNKVAHSAMDVYEWGVAASGRAIVVNKTIIEAMMRYDLDLYVVERGDRQVLGREDMRAMAAAAYLGELVRLS